MASNGIGYRDKPTRLQQAYVSAELANRRNASYRRCRIGKIRLKGAAYMGPQEQGYSK